MCGIAGIVDFAGRPIDRDALEHACVSLVHRGPDDRGIFVREHQTLSIGLTATRLAILDPTHAGHQPMATEDGRHVIVFNGLIYNFRELRDELRVNGYEFRGQSDTEVVLASCMMWGVDALPKFNGMWALAYFDLHANAGFVCRDRYGIKPLVIARSDQQLMFASEMRTLKMLGNWNREIDSTSVTEYVRYGFVLHPQTIYRNVDRLPPGHCMSIAANGESESTAYYALNTDGRATDHVDHRSIESRIRRTVMESVARRRVADVPIGAFLSGGLDSSIIVAHLAELNSQPVKTFSVGWADQAAYDETHHARTIADRFGTDHYELRCSHADVIDLLPRMLNHLGEPFFDSSILPAAIVSAFARQQVTVCLSGDGSDELFGGYWRYLAQQTFAKYRRIPQWIRAKMIERFARSVSVSKSSRLANRMRQFRKLLRGKSGDALARHLAWSRILSPEADEILRDSDADDERQVRIREETDWIGSVDPLERILAYDLMNTLPADMLQKVDLAGSLYALEIRVPFLDPDVVRLATSIPASIKVTRFGGKAILKQAYAGILPDEIIQRPKVGFEVPIGEFLRHELREMFCDTVTRETIESFELLNHDAIERVYNDHLTRRGEHADLLFALLSLCWWKQDG